MKKLIATLDRCEVRYLLISGQASILYGAATFSEDFDLWLAPSPSNVRKLLESLRALDAVVHRLTPPLLPKWTRGGHGFHFRMPADDTPELYLDVMFKPPRVREFAASFRKATILPSPWGDVRTCSVEDLIRLKRTRRAADYDVISNLVAGRVATAPKATRALLRWALKTSCRTEDRVAFADRLGMSTSPSVVRRAVLEDMRRMMELDVKYWSRRIAQLKRMRRDGALLPEGVRLRDLDDAVWTGAAPPSHSES